MNIEIKKSLSVLELGDLARIIEMQEKDIKLVDLSYENRLELLLETLIQERENRLINRLIKNAYFNAHVAEAAGGGQVVEHRRYHTARAACGGRDYDAAARVLLGGG